MSTAVACANIALVKYWGKRDAALNLPAAGSLSLTLDALKTSVRVSLADPSATDSLVIDGVEASTKARMRLSRFVDHVRARSGRSNAVKVESTTTFPMAAGLASSASAFAALACAVSRAFGLDLDRRELSILARLGSGSAARSVFGGFALMSRGRAPDGSDAVAEAISDARLDLVAAIAVAMAGEKAVGSSEGMERTRATSPYHGAWTELVERDLASALAALRSGDFDRLAEITEGSCLAMHANAMASRPGIVYFRSPTLWAIDRVRALRKGGTPVFFTVDAGPHLVAFTVPSALDEVCRVLAGHPEIETVSRSPAGPGVVSLDGPPIREAPFRTVLEAGSPGP